MSAYDAVLNFEKMDAAKLEDELRRRKLKTTGPKDVLIKRLKVAIIWECNKDDKKKNKDDFSYNNDVRRKEVISFGDVKEIIKTFSGEDETDIRSWMEKFEKLAYLCKWSEIRKIVYAKMLLRGLAKIFVGFSRCSSSWKKLKTTLIKEFARTDVCSDDPLSENKKKENSKKPNLKTRSCNDELYKREDSVLCITTKVNEAKYEIVRNDGANDEETRPFKANDVKVQDDDAKYDKTIDETVHYVEAKDVKLNDDGINGDAGSNDETNHDETNVKLNDDGINGDADSNDEANHDEKVNDDGINEDVDSNDETKDEKMSDDGISGDASSDDEAKDEKVNDDGSNDEVNHGEIQDDKVNDGRCNDGEDSNDEMTHNDKTSGSKAHGANVHDKTMCDDVRLGKALKRHKKYEKAAEVKEKPSRWVFPMKRKNDEEECERNSGTAKLRQIVRQRKCESLIQTCRSENPSRRDFPIRRKNNGDEEEDERDSGVARRKQVAVKKFKGLLRKTNHEVQLLESHRRYLQVTRPRRMHGGSCLYLQRRECNDDRRKKDRGHRREDGSCIVKKHTRKDRLMLIAGVRAMC